MCSIDMQSFVRLRLTVAMATLKNFSFFIIFSDTIFSKSLELRGYSTQLQAYGTVV